MVAALAAPSPQVCAALAASVARGGVKEKEALKALKAALDASAHARPRRAGAAPGVTAGVVAVYEALLRGGGAAVRAKLLGKKWLGRAARAAAPGGAEASVSECVAALMRWGELYPEASAGVSAVVEELLAACTASAKA